MSCAAPINPAFPPTRGQISHAPNASYSARPLMSPASELTLFVPLQPFENGLARVPPGLFVQRHHRGPFLGISDPEKSFMQMSAITLILIYQEGRSRCICSLKNAACIPSHNRVKKSTMGVASVGGVDTMDREFTKI